MPPGPWKSIVHLMHILTNGKTSTPWKSMRSLRYSGKLLLENHRLFRCRVQGQVSLVRGMGLNKSHTFPKYHWYTNDSVAASNIQYSFLGEGVGGAFFGFKEYPSCI